MSRQAAGLALRVGGRGGAQSMSRQGVCVGGTEAGGQAVGLALQVFVCGVTGAVLCMRLHLCACMRTCLDTSVRAAQEQAGSWSLQG